jgi:hypothetical protein
MTVIVLTKSAKAPLRPKIGPGASFSKYPFLRNVEPLPRTGARMTPMSMKPLRLTSSAHNSWLFNGSTSSGVHSSPAKQRTSHVFTSVPPLYLHQGSLKLEVSARNLSVWSRVCFHLENSDLPPKFVLPSHLRQITRPQVEPFPCSLWPCDQDWRFEQPRTTKGLGTPRRVCDYSIFSDPTSKAARQAVPVSKDQQRMLSAARTI